MTVLTARRHLPPCAHRDKCFISRGYDATSHFETEIEDVLDMYMRITGAGALSFRAWRPGPTCPGPPAAAAPLPLLCVMCVLCVMCPCRQGAGPGPGGPGQAAGGGGVSGDAVALCMLCVMCPMLQRTAASCVLSRIGISSFPTL